MAVYGYARVSTARQASEGESLDVQRWMIEGQAQVLGEPLVHVFVDEGVSGSVPLEQRPAGAALLARLAKGDLVIATKLDRMFRSALDTLTVVEGLRAEGKKLYLMDLGGDVTGNGLSRFFMTMVAAFAEVERDRVQERIRDVKADQKARGRYLGGKIPFGYRVGEKGALIEHEAEQEAIREMRRLRAEQKALRPIAEAMRAKGFEISHETVKQLLKPHR